MPHAGETKRGAAESREKRVQGAGPRQGRVWCISLHMGLFGPQGQNASCQQDARNRGCRYRTSRTNILAHISLR